jgi:hypothetical protein
MRKARYCVILGRNRMSPVVLILLALASGVAPPTTSKLYVSPDGSFQFTVPAGFRFYNSFDSSFGSYIPICEKDSSVCVMFPAERYKGTNFSQASFQVKSVNAETLGSCTNPGPDVWSNGKEHTRLIDGLRYTHGWVGAAAMSNDIERNIYRAFKNGACFELSINVTFTNFHVYEPGTIKEFTKGDYERVVQDLMRVLDSFKILH